MSAKTYDKKTAAFAGFLIQNIPGGLDEETMDGWMNNPAATKKFLAGLNPPKRAQATLLKPHDHIEVGPLSERLDPNAFFQTREGLYVWDSFSSRILRSAKLEEPVGKAKLTSFDLSRNAYDREIKAELSEQHEVALWHIAKLIEGQEKGEDGPLLTNGYANIFYFGGFAVYVYWDVGDREWDVYDWELGDVGWGAGRRVFSRN